MLASRGNAHTITLVRSTKGEVSGYLSRIHKHRLHWDKRIREQSPIMSILLCSGTPQSHALQPPLGDVPPDECVLQDAARSRAGGLDFLGALQPLSCQTGSCAVASG